MTVDAHMIEKPEDSYKINDLSPTKIGMTHCLGLDSLCRAERSLFALKPCNGLPRYAFIKIDTEPKPLFLDFDNPLSFDGISNALKNAGHAKFSEMRPCPDELWLEEERGRFCCEIRTTFSTCETPAT
ncbi:hypothetical protein [Pseudomonas sp. GL-RE-26]|uniref:hypothetical protein n=1 Tax=Pseudomonas sp. GL-RE-26 TaxID=2832390 RepID=UPI001CBF4B70|nr:hypothetical protein [Pseudomonas sp. GL-RE-26]